MTLSDAQTLRTATFNAITTILGGGVSSYQYNGRAANKLDIDKLWNRLTELDALIDRMTNGMFYVAQMRKPE